MRIAEFQPFLAPALALLALGLALAGCAPADPPTVTPPPPGSLPGVPAGGTPGNTVIEMTMAPPAPVTAEAILIGSVQPYRDAEGGFAIDTPEAWTESRQTAELSGDTRLGTVFTSDNRSGLLSITQFDNGRTPTSLGATANQVMDLTGFRNQPGFEELNRTNVGGQEGRAMLVEASYLRNNGVPMRGLILFQIDGTTFSMVNLAVESGSWVENEGAIRRILSSYRGPSAPSPASTGEPAPASAPSATPGA